MSKKELEQEMDVIDRIRSLQQRRQGQEGLFLYGTLTKEVSNKNMLFWIF
ncbi:Transcriptional regulator [Caenorhabditis elegans]|uniref:Transcriptional regulator n=1 Tax=Caenorhabditis elegans TaxID=6239 RepID=D2Y8W4_CAEEL|nr:Transcriptional regulator [Caenorhabditis elegans]CBI83222.1 Transcriptional regulator [Caenorhabditis elegans]|eukprot:NP_001254406.1 Uncharacterized protein CELE_C01B9.4 [Caenorhabditis elegans]